MEEKKKTSYRITSSVSPRWQAIAQWCFPNLKEKSSDEVWKFLSDLRNTGLRNEDVSLSKKYSQYDFVEFYDAVSGINTFWSGNDKKFIDELGIWGTAFGYSPLEFGDSKEKTEKLKRFFDNKEIPMALERRMVISPYGFGLEMQYDSLHPHFMFPEDTIVAFPYRQIVNFFLEAETHLAKASINHRSFESFKIKTFPETIKIALANNNITYKAYANGPFGGPDEDKAETIQIQDNLELFNIPVDEHYFESDFFMITVALQFFQPDDWNRIPGWAPAWYGPEKK